MIHRLDLTRAELVAHGSTSGLGVETAPPAVELLTAELEANQWDTVRTRVYLLKSISVLSTVIENTRDDLKRTTHLPTNANLERGRQSYMKEIIHYAERRAAIRVALELLDTITGASK